MEYTVQELRAREMREQGEKIKEIRKETKLSKDQIKACTRDIWLKIAKKRKENKRKARKRFLNGSSREETIKKLKITKHAYFDYVRDLRDKPPDYDSLRIAIREWMQVLVDEIQQDPRKYTDGTLLNQISAEFPEVTRHFVSDNTRDILQKAVFVDKLKGEWIYKGEGNGDPKKILYVNRNYLSRKLELSLIRVDELIREAKPSFILLWVNDKDRQIQRFYEYKLLESSSSGLGNKLRNLKRLGNLPPEHLINHKPKELSTREYYVLCVKIDIYNRTGFWPSNMEIADEISEYGNYQITFTEVKNLVRKLQEKGFITVTYKHPGNLKSHKRVIVHKGPDKLIARDVECPYCEYSFRLARDFVKPKKNGAEP